MSSNKYHIVVGGGIAGLVASHLLLNKGYNVLLAESSDKLGGLLTSKYINGRYYDHGTHLLRETGNASLDEFLFYGLKADYFEFIKNGSFYKQLFESNGFLSDETLSDELRKTALQELFKVSQQQNNSPQNLEEQLTSLYGSTYYDVLFKQIIQKLFFTNASDLSPDAHQLFGLGRIVAGDDDLARRLKSQSPSLDKVLAFYSYLQGKSNLRSLYPKNGGAGAWIESIENKLLKEGLLILKNAKLKFIRDEHSLKSVDISGSNYEVEKVYWTVPPIFLYDAAGIDKPQVNLPKRLTSIVVDMEVHGNYLTDLFYVHNYDPNLKSFRVTLYDNYNVTSESEVKRITVEFLAQSDDSVDYKSLAQQELVEMNLIDVNTKTEVVNVSVIKNGFPIPTSQFRKDSGALVEGLSQLDNLVLFGKAAGKSWFMNEVIMEIYRQLGE